MKNNRNVLIVCVYNVCVGGGGERGDNEMWWRWCWMENSRNVWCWRRKEIALKKSLDAL